MRECKKCGIEMIYDGFGYECDNGCHNTSVGLMVETDFVCPNCRERDVYHVDSELNYYRCESCFKNFSLNELEEVEDDKDYDF